MYTFKLYLKPYPNFFSFLYPYIYIYIYISTYIFSTFFTFFLYLSPFIFIAHGILCQSIQIVFF